MTDHHRCGKTVLKNAVLIEKEKMRVQRQITLSCRRGVLWKESKGPFPGNRNHVILC